jgi:phosphatidylinositol-3-phosphatase
MDQLQDAKLTWKGYFEDLPGPGSMVIYDPSPERKDLERPQFLYAAKHNGFLNFDRVREDSQVAEKIVPLKQLADDLAAGALPNYAHIVLNQCNEMHGLQGRNVPSDCVLDRHKPETLHSVIRRGDAAISAIVDQILKSSVWSSARNVAVVVTWDEDDRDTVGAQGCCGYEPGSSANFGGGHIPTIVITNHGPSGVTDPTSYNHYSLLRTCEEAFGLTEYLGFAAADDKGVRPMTPLFELRSQQ